MLVWLGRLFATHGQSSLGRAYACDDASTTCEYFFFLLPAHPRVRWPFAARVVLPCVLGLGRKLLITHPTHSDSCILCAQLAFPRKGRTNQRFGARSQLRAVRSACLAWQRRTSDLVARLSVSQPHYTRQRSLDRRAYACDANAQLVNFFSPVACSSTRPLSRDRYSSASVTSGAFARKSTRTVQGTRRTLGYLVCTL